MAYKEKFRFTFQNPGKLVFSAGAVKKVGDELKALGVSRPLLVTDEAIAGSAMVASVKAALGSSLAGVFDRVIPDSGVEVVNQGAALARELKADSVVSVGGGSSMDTAKGVAVLLKKNIKDVRQVIGFFKVKESPVPHIAIPTTAGTGSEVTSMAVIKDWEKNVKSIIVDNAIIPPVGILDPELLLGLPPLLTASTGMDAMTHAVEAMISTNHMPPADALATHAIGLLLEFLPQAVTNGSDLEARSMTLIASAEAGQAFQNAYVGVVHALAHALGGMFGVPHGMANAMFLAEGMAYNLELAAPRLAAVAQAMGIASSNNDQKDGKAAIAKMQEFSQSLGLPQKLSEVKVDPGRLEDCAKLALADAALSTNPRRPSGHQELLQIYRARL
jgi:alcohol dehydrogenase